MSVISRKNQVTIPVEVLREAGLEPGDDVVILAAGRGRVELMRGIDAVRELAGSVGDAAYPPGYLEEERRGWR